MKKIKNKLRKMIVMLCTVAAFLCCSLVSVFADEEVTDPNLNIGSTFDGKHIPYLPEEVYGKNYVLVYQGYDNFFLYVLPSDCVVSGKQDNGSPIYTGGGSVVLTFNFPTDTLNFTYSYSSSSGWSEPSVVSGSALTITPPAVYLLKSTIDIMSSASPATVFFGANTEVIYKNDFKVFLDDFGGLLTGSIGVISSSVVGVVGVFMVIIPVIVGLFYALLRRD